MSDAHGTGRRGLTATAIAVLLLEGLASAHAAPSTELCLAKKLKECAFGRYGRACDRFFEPLIS
jgi:hypothetical protein